MVKESEVRERAYALWQKDARPEGAQEFYWRLAQQQLESEVQASQLDIHCSLSRELECGPDQSVAAQQP
ncbi:DUF2934 domain-containing protein [Pseudomonas canadensis]|uniref:DUF2934 domain-containing protein n=1 Tax=Pseudomonas canadensis TaxID=915099 RepID=UPI0038620B43